MTSPESRPLDDTDWALLRELQDNARMTFAELGRRVGLTSPAVQERIRRMEEAGIIEGYGVHLNTKKLGLGITSFSRLLNLLDAQAGDTVMGIARETPEVLDCYHVMGQDEFLLRIAATSVDHLEQVLHRFKPYCQSISSIVISAPVKNRSIEQAITRGVIKE